MTDRLSLEALLHPRSIAIVGMSRASGRQNTIDGSAVLRSLVRYQYSGALHLVHPEGGELDGRPVHRSIAELPEAPDLAVISLGAQRVPQAIADCGARGIRAAVVMSAGFSELGDDEGRHLELALREAAERYGVAICGPNGLGYVNVPKAIYAGYFPCLSTAEPNAGGLSVVTHSGAIGNSLLARAIDRQVGIGCIVSAGNETNVTLADYLEFLVDDPDTRVLSIYLEGVADGRRLRRAFERAAAAGKPVVAYKVGKSAAGAKAALSHTAKIAGEPALYRGLFRQCGVIEATRLDDLIEIPMFLLKTRIAEGPAPRGVGVVTISGGLGAIVADHFAAEGFDVPALSAATQAALQALPLKFGSTANPVDTTAAIQRDEGRLADILSAVAADPSVDALVFPNASRFPERALDVARIMADTAERFEQPLISLWYAGSDNDPAMQWLHASRKVACFDDPSAGARALAALRDFRAFVARRDTPVADASAQPAGDASAAGVVQNLCGVLSEPDGKRLLAAHGVPLLPERRASEADEAVWAAAALGWPVAMKIVSADVPHKASAGGVALGLGSAAEVRAAFERMLADVSLAHPLARLEGVLVSPMASLRAELIVGMTIDATLGPALVVGAGGGDVERLRDAAMRLLPASPDDCRQMLDEIADPRIRVLEAPHKERLAQVVHRIARMCVQLAPRLQELDVNPLALTRDGEVVALDAMLVLDDR